MTRSMRRAAAMTTVALLGCASTTTAAAAPAPPKRWAPGPVAPSLAGLVDALGADAADAGDARFAHLRKLDGHLQTLAADRLRGRDLGDTARREALTLSSDERRVQVDVLIAGAMDAAVRALRAQGMDVGAVSDREPQRIVEGTLPASALTTVAGMAATTAVFAVQGFGTNEGSVLSQGDAAHRGPQARALGSTGAGVKVGIVSDSINRVGGGVATSQASGNLPGPASVPAGQVQVLLDGSPSSVDEGRAMAEIVFDTAPGVRNMLFTTGQGAATRATGIDNLVANGAKVIADDTFQITEPFFQDGVVAQAVDRAKAAGVAYLVSAGNRARQSWEGTYAPTTDPRAVSPSANDFDPGAGADAVQTIGTFTDRDIFISLQWDEPFNQASTDLAVDVFGISGGVPSYAFTVDTDNIATTRPAEFTNITVTGTATVGISIRRKTGTRNPFMKYIVGGTPTFSIAEHATNSNAIDPDASSAKGALTVAASSFATPAVPEPFSSRGNAFKLFDTAGNRLASPEVRLKPDLSAADEVATSVPGFTTFRGTSAAAPSAAGVAALVLAAKPTLSVEALAAILRNPANTIDCTATAGVPDSDCGFGFVLAEGAVQSALNGSPPSVTANVSPAAPNGANGWYSSGNVDVTWTTTYGGSPIAIANSCVPASVSTDTASATFTCAATSGGGTTTQSVAIKRDASPPSPPAFSGIAAQSYSAAQLPAANAIGCTASDPTSGVSGCAVSGHSSALGTNTLTATATNGAGLTSTATLAYTVIAPAPPAVARLAAISGLTVSRSRVKVASIVRSGVAATLTAARANTKLKVTLRLRGKIVGTLSKTVRKGRASLRVTLTRTGRARLRANPGTLAITVTGSAAGVTTTTLKASLKTRR